VSDEQLVFLTPRELETLALIGQGKTSKEVATALSLSAHTIAHYRKGLCRKLNVHSTAELVAFGATAVRPRPARVTELKSKRPHLCFANESVTARAIEMEQEE
jgi:DNA-binding CsgD family transcriptional regulator